LRLLKDRFPHLKAITWIPLLLLALTGCATYPNSALSPAGPVAGDELHLMEIALAIMILVFLVVVVLWGYAIIKFRQRKGDTEDPKPWDGSTILESMWIIGPFLALAFLAYITVSDSFILAAKPPAASSVTVEVVGHQFWWEFDYKNSGVTTANEMVIPVGEKVELNLTSADVIHSFWIPRLAGKIDALPGYMNHMWIEASKPGVYPGQCAEFCGTGHADMGMKVIAVSQTKYRAWLHTMKHPTFATTALARQGMKDFATVGCATCHSIVNTPYQGKVGPNLTDLGIRTGIAADTLPNTPANLARWLHDPQAVKPGALMPNLGLSKKQISALVAFLEGMK